MIATIDIGTNSVRLLVGEERETQIIPVVTRMEITRLGAGVDRTGVLSEAAIVRTCQTLLKYKDVLKDYQVDKLVVTATSAVRDARNQQEFLAKVLEKTGLSVSVLTGEEEAQASFVGAITALTNINQKITSDLLVLDIGGGSTEIIYGQEDGTILKAISGQIGAVRMTELLNTKSEAALLNLINQRVDELISDLGNTQNPRTLVGVGGTITTLAALELELEPYDAQKITGFKLTIDTVGRWLDKLKTMDPKSRAVLPGISPGRSDIIVAGVTILLAVMNKLAITELLVSDADLLQGIIFSLKES